MRAQMTSACGPSRLGQSVARPSRAKSRKARLHLASNLAAHRSAAGAVQLLAGRRRLGPRNEWELDLCPAGSSAGIVRRRRRGPRDKRPKTTRRAAD